MGAAAAVELGWVDGMLNGTTGVLLDCDTHAGDVWSCAEDVKLVCWLAGVLGSDGKGDDEVVGDW